MYGFQQSKFGSPAGTKIQEFFAASNGVNQWQTWVKPLGLTFAQILCGGGGSSGAGGQSNTSGTARAAGGGGGSGAMTRLLIPLIYLPDVLYIQVGAGGLGVPANNNGNTGNRSFVAIYPGVSNPLYVVAVSGTAAATAALATTAAGVGETISVVGSQPYSSLGIWTAIAGSNGTTGGANTGANGTSLTPSTLFGGGAGGASTNTANTNFIGGNINAAANYPQISGGTAGGGNGSSGWGTRTPFINFGGAGGGSNGTGLAGDGGDGALMCGGGGGGSGVTGGRGGRGGDGYVSISCW